VRLREGPARVIWMRFCDFRPKSEACAIVAREV
jgi:hypothetical protein